MEFAYENLAPLFGLIIALIVVVLSWAVFYSGLPSKKAVMEIIQDELNTMPLNRDGSPINTMKINGSGLISKGAELIVLKRLIVVFPHRKVFGLKFKAAPCIMFDKTSLRDRLFTNYTYYNIFRIVFWESTNTITFWFQASTNEVEFSESYHRIKFKGQKQKEFVKMMDQHSKNWYSKGKWNRDSNDAPSSVSKRFWRPF